MVEIYSMLESDPDVMAFVVQVFDSIEKSKKCNGHVLGKLYENDGDIDDESACLENTKLG